MFSYIFPRVEKKDFRRFFSACVMFLCIALTYSIFRKTKDTVVATRMFVELISTIKTCVILPVTTSVVLLYQYVSSKLSDDQQDDILKYTTLIFMVYFVFYGICEFINGTYIFQFISPHSNLAGLVSNRFLYNLFYQLDLLISGMWHVLFYTLTELYGTMVLSFGFWRFVNAYTSIEEAKIFYPYFIGAASLSTSFAGVAGLIFNKVLVMLNYVGARYGEMYNVCNICLCCVLMCISLYCYNISLGEYRACIRNESHSAKKSSSKPKVGFIDGIMAILSSRILFFLNFCVMAYMSSINIVEVTWKKQIVETFSTSDRQGYDNFLNMVQVAIGISVLVLSYVSQYVYSRFGWLVTALLNPIGLGVTGLIFFMAVNSFTPIGFMLYGYAHVIGAVQNVASKSLKYSSFDYTKEMAFLYLDKDTRNRGKAAIDGLGGRFGKAGGSFIQMLLITLLVPKGQIQAGQTYIAPYMGLILAFFVVVWIFSVIQIGMEIERRNRVIRQEEDAQKQREARAQQHDSKLHTQNTNDSDNRDTAS